MLQQCCNFSHGWRLECTRSHSSELYTNLADYVDEDDVKSAVMISCIVDSLRMRPCDDSINQPI